VAGYLPAFLFPSQPRIPHHHHHSRPQPSRLSTRAGHLP
jgi:hypothetical protein